MSILCGVYIGVAFTPIGSHFRIENLQVRFAAKANMIATARREAPRPLSRSTNTPPALRSKLMQSVSALPPKADLCGAVPDVCFGPKADIGRTKWSVGMRYTIQAAIMSTVPIKQPNMGVLNQQRHAITVKAPPTSTIIGFSHEI